MPGTLLRLVEAFDRLGVRFGSHDDPDPDAEARARFHLLGARICEFPTILAAAETARAQGDHVLMGAPNTVRGGSQSGSIAAETPVARGLCAALVSDDHYRACRPRPGSVPTSGCAVSPTRGP